MTKIVQFVGMTSSQAAQYIGPPRMVVVDINAWTLRVQDGLTPGGFLLLSANNNLSDLDNRALARNNLDLGTAALADTTDFDPAGAAASALTTAEAYADAVGAAAEAASDPSGSAATAQSNAEDYTDTQVALTLKIANDLSDLHSIPTARTNLNVPTRTGGDASGTWPISISGNAATANSATTASSATTATTASTANALNSGNSYSVYSLSATNEITAFASDIRLKTKIKTIENAVNRVKMLNGVTYEWNEIGLDLGFSANKRFAGLIAQDVQRAQPEAIRPAPADERYMTYQPEQIIPLLVEAIKELKAEIDELRGRK